MRENNHTAKKVDDSINIIPLLPDFPELLSGNPIWMRRILNYI